MKGKHFVSIDQLSRDDVEMLLAKTREMRGRRDLEVMRGRSAVFVFFNPSLRTRVSMEIAVAELGGKSVVLEVGQGGIWDLEWRDGVAMDAGPAEHVKEAARVLSRYADLIGVRAFPRRISLAEDMSDPIINAFARHATVPVVNLESCLHHPCQTLADICTMREKVGENPGKVVLSWGYHPKALPVAVPSSFALGVSKMGWDLTIAYPEGYDLPSEIMEAVRRNAKQHGGKVDIVHEREKAYRGAKVLYGKSWGSLRYYGRERDEMADRRSRGLTSWVVDDKAMGWTDGARFMHCLPVRRNVYVSDAVLDSPAAIHVDQAENRLHVQKALLAAILGG